ncbi:hypothetical protein PR048_007434, partial [Dryococelus australis]
MSGPMKGAQTVISSKHNTAIYIHCFSYSLNLALINTSITVPEISNVLKIFGKNTTLKPLSPTRWTVRTKSLNVLNSQYETILSVLYSLKSKESVANGLSTFSEKISSLFYLEVSVIVFGITEELVRNLQTSDISITSALRQTEI